MFVIGHYVFEEDGVNVNVNFERYIDMLAVCSLQHQELRRRRFPRSRVWFLQRGATHTSNDTINILRQNYPIHLIYARGEITRPPRSPDLSTISCGGI